MNLHLGRSLALLTCLFLPLQGHTAVDVYSQAPTGTFADTSAVWNDPHDPGFNWSLDGDKEVWSYFTLPSSVTFDRISWYGSNTDGDFAVDLFAATCYSCGLSWAGTEGDFTNNLLATSLFSQAEVHKTLLSGNTYSYYIDLPTAITLDGSSPYYALSIVNNYTSKPFQWSAASSGLGSHLYFIVGQAMVLSTSGNLAFTLTDTMAVPVPEPETYALLIAGLGMVGAAVRRRRKA
ncbi:MAG: PEPxxWA-CTERM sorting domain-containing protein [Pseudomonadota bacterium]